MISIRKRLIIEKLGRECARCEKFMSWDNFNKGSTKQPNGRSSYCRSCDKLRAYEFFKRNIN